MAFTRPDLQTIVDRVKADIRSALGITAILRRSTEDAFSKAIGGAANSLHGHMRFISKQIFPDQAEVIYLERWASIYGIGRTPATFTVLSISGTGTDGSVIPIGTGYQRSDGVTYTSTTAATIAAGVFTIEITADDAGLVANLADGEGLSLSAPISGVDTAAVVSSTVTVGEDLEGDDSLRERVLLRIRNPPSGGTAADYISYARSVSGVTRAWVFPGHLGEGTVGVSFVQDGNDPIIPIAAKVTEVQTAVDLAKPVTAEATVFAPNANTVNISVAISPNTAAVQATITAELDDLFAREGQVAGAYKQVGVNYDGSLALSKINEAISIADGEDNHNLISPSADIVSPTGSIITLGTITFSTLA